MVTKRATKGGKILLESVVSQSLGGSQFDDASQIAVAPNGSVLITGSTFSPDFPAINAAPDFGSAGRTGLPHPLRDFDGCSTPDTDLGLCHQSAVPRPSTALRGTLLTGRNML